MRAEKVWDKETFPRECLYILGVVALGLILNFIISHTPLVAYSSGYAQANATLYAGGLLTKIFANCISIPILEELVYRGIVCGQLSLWYDEKIAVIISAFCFGIMHFNVVQFFIWISGRSCDRNGIYQNAQTLGSYRGSWIDEFYRCHIGKPRIDKTFLKET